MEVFKIKNSSSEIVYQKLLNYILNGNIAPGGKIDEPKLSQKFGVSRTPLREAIRRLQSESLISVEPQKGARLKRLSNEELHEIYTVRSKLEGLATELAVNNIGEPEEKKILEFKKKFRFSLEKNKPLKWLDDNIEFHYFFAKLSKNDTLFQIIKNLNIRVHKYRYISLMNPEYIEEYSSHHEEILHNAIVTRNPKKAGKMMEIHLDVVKKNLINSLNNFPFY